MRRIAISIAATMLAWSTVAPADDYVYGPVPDWTRFKQLAEPAVRAKIPSAKLGDPAGWSIVWPNGYRPQIWRHKGRFHGYLTCGYLLPIAPADGRYRQVNFIVVVDHDVVQTVDISSRESNSLVNMGCDSFVSRGLLPPADMMAAPAETTIAQLGLTVRVMDEGAYVVAVAPGSRAARARLASGMVLTSLNAIPLTGMGPAMITLLGADSRVMIVTTAAGGRIDLGAQP